MANKNRDFDRATEPRETNPSTGADDRVEHVRGTADEADEFEESDDDEMDVDEEQEEGTF